MRLILKRCSAGMRALEYEDAGVRKLVINNRKYLEVLTENPEQSG